MTPSELQHLRELCEQATPEIGWSSGVWYGTDEGGWAAIGPHHDYDDLSGESDEPGSEPHRMAEHDARFIAAARSAVPALIEEVERLRALLGEACETPDAYIPDPARPDAHAVDRARIAEIRRGAGL